jgi:hypothetical protein
MGRGGIATLTGIKYEIKAVLYEIPKLLRGEIKSLRYQPISSALKSTDAPKKISADDFAIVDANEQGYYCQAKHNTRDPHWTVIRLISEGVMEQFLRQHKSTPDGMLRFVSNLPANPLKSLAEHAKQSVSYAEFKQTLTDQWKIECEAMTAKLNVEIPELWGMLQKVECILLPPQVIDDRIGDYAHERYKDADKFVLVLGDFIENNPGRLIDREMIRKVLEEKGLYPLPRISDEEAKAEFRQASAPLRLYRSDIRGVHIERQETETLFEWIKTPSGDNRLAFLLDIAGSGKSVIMKDLLLKLEDEGTPVVAIKADVLGSIIDESQLQSALALSDSPEKLLSLASRDRKAVMLVDQLDGLSQTFARNQDCLDVMIRLITRGARIDNVYVVVSCRDFDHKFDPKLRQISSREFKIKRLERRQIEKVLENIKISWDDLTSCEQDLLTTPQHLFIYADVVAEKSARGQQLVSFATIQDVYNELWNLKILHAQNCPVSHKDLQDAVYTLADAIYSTQLLTQPISILDNFIGALKYLQSEGILYTEGQTVRFFHQSFFDYCYGRRLVVQNKSLADLIYDSDQGFFVRPQMVQTLTYLRGTNERRYLEEVGSLMGNHDDKLLRYHLRSLLFAWFGQQRNLTEAEKTLGLTCIQTDSRRSLFLDGANGNFEWFDVLEGHLGQLFELPDEDIDRVLTFLISVEDERGDAVFNILKEKGNTSPSWHNRIQRCLALYKKWDSNSGKDVLFQFCLKTPNPWNDTDLMMHSVTKANITLACEALEVILDRSFEEWSKIDFPPQKAASEFELGYGDKDAKESVAAYYRESVNFEKDARKLIPFDKYWFKELSDKASTECPKLFVAIILPWLEKCLPKLVRYPDADGWLRDEIFKWAFSGTRMNESSTYMIEGLIKGLKNIAETDEKTFLDSAKKMADSRHLVLHQVLIRVLLAKAKKYASWACEYFLADPLRFDVEEEACGGNISRKLVAAIFTHLKQSERVALEKAIMEYYPDWENKPDCLQYRGNGQYELLFGITDTLLTQRGLTRKQQLQRKFPDRKPSEPRRGEVTAVGSPIPQDKCKILSDKDWLAAMKHFDDSTGWDQPREHFGKGGLVELSRAFQAVVKEDPERHVSLVESFDQSISSKYFSAFVKGFEESGIVSTRLFEICRRVVDMRPNDVEIQRAVCDVLQKRAKDGVPENLIEYIRQVALTSPDPKYESREEENAHCKQYHRGNFHEQGINTVRGRAVISYAVCVRQGKTCDVDELFNSLEQVATDESSAVRACLIEVLPYVLHFDREGVINIFECVIKGRSELLDNRVSQDFIYYAMQTHAKEMLKHIRELTMREDGEICESAGRLAALAFFETDEARKILRCHMNNRVAITKAVFKILATFFNLKVANVKAIFQDYVNFSKAFRKGTATVFARNVDNPKLLNKCLERLLMVCKKKEIEVMDAIGGAFEYLPPPGYNDVAAFINRFICTDFSTRTAEKLLKYAIDNCRLHAEFALKIGEKIFDKFCKNKSLSQEFYWHIDDDMINLIVAVYNKSTNTNIRRGAMDLFDGVMEAGSAHARSVLKSLDR